MKKTVSTEWPVGPLGRSLSRTMMKRCLRVIERPTHQSSIPKLERKAGGIVGWEMILSIVMGFNPEVSHFREKQTM